MSRARAGPVQHGRLIESGAMPRSAGAKATSPLGTARVIRESAFWATRWRAIPVRLIGWWPSQGLPLHFSLPGCQMLVTYGRVRRDHGQGPRTTTEGEFDLPLTEFERVLHELGALTRTEIAALAIARVSETEREGFAVLAERLSIETLRFLCARALHAANSYRRPTLTWLAPGVRLASP